MNQPPWEYLADCSLISLENFMLAMHARADQLRKNIAADNELLRECERNAEIAFTLIHHGDQLARLASLRQQVFKFADATPPVIEAPAKRPLRSRYRKEGAA